MESNSTLKSTGNSIHRLKKENYSTTQGNYYNRTFRNGPNTFDINSAQNTINNQNFIVLDDVINDTISKKTNSTGDITPCRTPSMTQDFIDQYFINENFMNLQTVNESHLNTNNNINNVVNQLNIIKINEYIQKEKEMLESENKTQLEKSNFKKLKNILNSLEENVKKHFILPKKSKDKEMKYNTNEFLK